MFIHGKQCLNVRQNAKSNILAYSLKDILANDLKKEILPRALVSGLFPDRLTIMIYNNLLYINVSLAHIFDSQNIYMRNGILISLRPPRVLWK